jgi:hypothetical protein
MSTSEQEQTNHRLPPVLPTHLLSEQSNRRLAPISLPSNPSIPTISPNPNPPVPPLAIPSGTLTFSAQDLIAFEKESAPVPENLVKNLAKKWRSFFQIIVAKHKNTREFVIPLTALQFKNRFNVRWQPPQISVDVVQKTFQLHSRPSSRQDQLCFEPVCDPGFCISFSGRSLKGLITRFFETINQVRWCSECGEFSWNYAYNPDSEICDHCLIEEICVSPNAESYHCSICLEEGKRMYKTRCGHHFHRKCLSKIESTGYGPRCPLCRVYLDPEDEHLRDVAEENGTDEI